MHPKKRFYKNSKKEILWTSWIFARSRAPLKNSVVRHSCGIARYSRFRRFEKIPQRNQHVSTKHTIKKRKRGGFKRMGFTSSVPSTGNKNETATPNGRQPPLWTVLSLQSFFLLGHFQIFFWPQLTIACEICFQKKMWKSPGKKTSSYRPFEHMAGKRGVHFGTTGHLKKIT